MKNLRKSLLIIFAIVAFGPTAWAQEKEITWTEVGTKEALNSAIADGAYIRLTADITLSEYLKIGQSAAQTVTIDLNGHTLSRNLNAADANGHVIEVFSNGTLTLTGGTLTGGWANNGGGICNYGSLTIGDNVTITGCKANDGGGIKNNAGATLTINGGCITGNIATGNGCGIWSNGTLNMQGNVTVTGNTREDGVPQNVFLKSGKMITLTGSFTDGAQVAVLLEAGSGKFTSGYGTHNSGTAPSTYFTADLINLSVTLSEGEAMLSSLEGTVYYIEREWDSIAKKVKATQKTVSDFHVMNNNTTTLANNTWYVVNGNVAPKGYKKHDKDAVKVDGTAHLIICDGAKLKAAIDLEAGSTLHIYAQSFGTGMINADGGIGPGRRGKMGDLFIHGGIIDAQSQSNDAGIGTCYAYDPNPNSYSSIDGGNVTIYDGTITAAGGSYGAGIGGGSTAGYESYEQHIKIYGGNVVAEGGWRAAGIGTGTGLETEEIENNYLIEIFGGNVEARGGKYGAGIGSGQGISAGTLKVYGGIVKAYGGEDGAGIGCGERTTGTISTINGGKVFVNGGKVYAYGGKYSAGIGGGQDSNGATVVVNDGYVFADGGTDAAGIGCGEKYMPGTPNGGKLTVNGGHVFADGTGWGAGIGGGEDSDGAEVIINGGIVEAYAGSDAGNKSGCAIGSEDGDGHRGSLQIGDSLMVHAGSTPTSNSLFTAPERVPACYFRPYARIEPCDHQGATYTVSGTGADDTHTLQCTHCNAHPSETHTFDEDHVCTVCHVNASVSTAYIYLPVYNDGTYSYSAAPVFTQQLVTGSTFQLPAPPDNHIPAGVRFVGWRVGSPSDLGLTDPRVTENEQDILAAGSSYTINGDVVSFTPRYKTFHVFTTAGNWNVESNWCWNVVPDTTKEIVIAAEATVPANYTAQLGDNVIIDLGGSITIADGGQLKHSNAVPGTIQKFIAGYNDISNPEGWYLLGAPLRMDSVQAVNSGMVGLVDNHADFDTHGVDLYEFSPNKELEWRNMRVDNRFRTMGIALNTAYLYARADDCTLNFSTTEDELFAPTTSDTYIAVTRSISTPEPEFIGWSLIRNPYTCNAYLASGRDFYRMNAAGDAIVLATEENGGSAIKPCEGFFVVVGEHDPEEYIANTNTGYTMAARIQMTTTEPEPSGDKSLLDITVKQEGRLADVARVRFGNGDRTGKLVLRDNATRLSIMQDGKECSVVNVGRDGVHTVSTEIPVNFKAKRNGQYTITVNPEGVEMGYLHLIDNLTGNDVDLLAYPSYTFTAKTDDYASRFKLVFNAIDNQNDNGNDDFAFISNGNIIVNGTGTLQLIDVTGRILATYNAANRIGTDGLAAGVYVLRLINGENVKTQKIVVE